MDVSIAYGTPVPPLTYFHSDRNQLVRHVLEVGLRPAANLGPERITAVPIPHLGVRPPSADGHRLVQLHHLNLGAILFFETRKMWIHLDPACPLHPQHGRHPPAAYASVFNLVLLDQLSTDNSENEMCQIANFPRIAHDVLSNSPDDYQQRDFFHEFKHWVLQVLGEPATSNKLVVDTFGWLRRESPQLREMDAEDLRRYGADMGQRVTRALRRVVELVRPSSASVGRMLIRDQSQLRNP